jgi:hypothetical protein
MTTSATGRPKRSRASSVNRRSRRFATSGGCTETMTRNRPGNAREHRHRLARICVARYHRTPARPPSPTRLAAVVTRWATDHPALIPHEPPGSTRPCPRNHATTRAKSPAPPVIPAYPRSARKRHDRPVAPEVAGSSPVAPVENILQTAMFCCPCWRKRPPASRRPSARIPPEISRASAAEKCCKTHVLSPVEAADALRVFGHPARIPLALDLSVTRARQRHFGADLAAHAALSAMWPSTVEVPTALLSRSHAGPLPRRARPAAASRP